MQSRLSRIFTVTAIFGALDGCAWDRPLAPEKDVAFAMNGLSPGGSFVLGSTAQSQSEILLTWQDNAANESGFEVHRSTSGGSGTFTPYTTTGANVATLRDSELTTATEYCYMVRAVFTKGRKTTYSSFSNISCATTLPLPIPPAPSNTAVTPISSTSVRVIWAADNAQDGFRIERAASIDGPWETAAGTSGSTRAHIDASLASELSVCYRVIAFSGSGDSPPSIVDCTNPPAAPTNLVISRYDATTVDLTWTDNSTVEDGYEVRRAGIDGVWSVIATLPTNAAGHRDTGLNSASKHSYAVFATKDGGYSDEIKTDESEFADPPTAPSTITAQPSSSVSVYVGWSGAQNAAGYRVERSTDGGSSWVSAGRPAATAKLFLDEGRTPEQPVWYRVFALNNTGESPPSPVGSTTPPAAPTNVEVVRFGDGTVEFRWTDNSNVEDGYELYYHIAECDADDECYQWWGTPRLPPNTTSLRVTGNAFLSQVRALKDGGHSEWVR